VRCVLRVLMILCIVILRVWCRRLGLCILCVLSRLVVVSSLIVRLLLLKRVVLHDLRAVILLQQEPDAIIIVVRALGLLRWLSVTVVNLAIGISIWTRRRHGFHDHWLGLLEVSVGRCGTDFSGGGGCGGWSIFVKEPVLAVSSSPCSPPSAFVYCSPDGDCDSDSDEADKGECSCDGTLVGEEPAFNNIKHDNRNFNKDAYVFGVEVALANMVFAAPSAVMEREPEYEPKNVVPTAGIRVVGGTIKVDGPVKPVVVLGLARER
jgi:hypothetical protein